ncbi:uncharacterized protein G2W53_016465 [Senna tora]|uniref:Uncharacterized protein n=1 Tax=Senna tora TaxID=362788 RepID=A0A834TQW1_9FABA|nr:uncharacterized protein G2W53_016465 [Senna tora]
MGKVKTGAEIKEPNKGAYQNKPQSTNTRPKSAETKLIIGLCLVLYSVIGATKPELKTERDLLPLSENSPEGRRVRRKKETVVVQLCGFEEDVCLVA